VKQLLQTRWSEIDPLLDAIEDVDAEQRRAWLEARGIDAELRDAVLALLATSFESNPLDRLREHVTRVEPLPCGGRIGEYRLLKRVGAGGMATVYLAERSRPELTQRVALKLMRSGLYDPALQALFRREQQILARLEHAGIARLIDAGITDADVPYLVMEFVDGLPIDAYCREHGLGVEQRLGLFLQVCDAVAYAHRHLLVHRDLKPANILVAPGGVVRLLDFGIAKLLEEGDAATRTMAPRATPAYAAPEQVSDSGPASTATDVYALGVILCELLAGQRPQWRADGSLRLPSSLELGAFLPNGSPARSWQRRLRGDLDSIIGRALRAVPEERYPDAAELRADVQRHLDGMPVRARPEAWSYRASRFLRRHRYAAVATAIVFLALAGALVATTIGFDRARASAAEARAAQQRSESVNRFLRQLLIAPRSANLGADARVVDMLDEAAVRLVAEQDVEPVVRGSLEGVLGETYFALGNKDRGELLLREAHERLAQHAGRDDPQTLDVELALAEAQVYDCDLEPAQRGLDALEPRLAASYPPTHALRLRFDINRAQVAACRGDAALQESLARTALQRTVAARTPDEFEWAVELLANAQLAQGRYADAERTLRDALKAMDGAPGGLIRRLQLQNVLIETLHALGSLGEAERLARENLAAFARLHGEAPHPQLAVAQISLANVLMERGTLDESLALFDRALVALERLHGADSDRVLEIRGNRANVLKGLGQFDEAEAQYRAIIEGLARLGEVGVEARLRQGFNLAELLNERQRHADAIAVALPALEEAQRELGDGNLITLELRDALAVAHLARGDFAQAERLLRESVRQKAGLLGVDSPYTLAAGHRLAEALWRLGEADEARALLGDVAARRVRTLGEDHPDVQASRALLARIKAQR
jgi:tetratricopeptide (TPR) repeat protein/tRNA A-37 threonylcarbamoyl transferase component Bud32